MCVGGSVYPFKRQSIGHSGTLDDYREEERIECADETIRHGFSCQIPVRTKKDALRGAYCSELCLLRFLGLPGPGKDVPFAENEIFEEAATCNLRDSTSTNDCGSSVLQHIQIICLNHAISVSSDVLPVQDLGSDWFVAIALTP